MQIDADLSHDPADIPRLIAAARDGADVVLGSRYAQGGGRRAGAPAGGCCRAAAGATPRLVLGLDVQRPHRRLQVLDRARPARVDLDGAASRGYAFQIELTYEAVVAGLAVAEVPIVFRERERGRSKMSAGIALEALWRVPLLRLRARHAGLGAPVAAP